MSDAREIIEALCDLMGSRLPGLTRVDSGMEAQLEWRYGRLNLTFDHDQEAESIRIFICVPPPAGAGPEFLTWCLATNVLYWDVKLGLDGPGMLVVHADVDLEQADLVRTAEVLLGRVDAMSELIDGDLVAYIDKHGLATPAQADRWAAWVDPDAPA